MAGHDGLGLPPPVDGCSRGRGAGLGEAQRQAALVVQEGLSGKEDSKYSKDHHGCVINSGEGWILRGEGDW